MKKLLVFVALVVIVVTGIVQISRASKTRITCTTDPNTYASTCTTTTPN